MNNKFKLGTFALTTTLLLTGVSTHTTYAATNDTTTDAATTQSQQTTQGERPYGGIPPQGMTNEQYAELEQNVPNPNSVSQQQYQLALNDATQDIADKYNTTITVPEGSFKPNAVRDDNGHALPLTKDGNFYQTNVDENGVNHPGSKMLNDQTDKAKSDQSQQTTQGERPYGGIPPQGMTNEQYAELEQNVPNPNSVSQQQYQLALNDATQDIADKYNTTITVAEGVFKPNAVRDNNGHALPLTKDGNFYQTNVDENGVNHGGSEMLNDQTEKATSNQTQQTNHAQQQITKEHKQALPNTGAKETPILATTAIGALILAIGVFFTFKRKNSSH
ncbi:LPXTG cell wall anchor domain-containing protein [Staphylococcus petrasii]|uniref:LPXTG cell wall anchor domain-containing protein n=2 Tax=Staphylococcus petrasii TaxID=1276936 RepID=UPI000E06DF96|nr:LPXTG cell wall anchor domain-containing protein [Staphylococcus petrasii]TGA81268.1 LPXTG cell wall anchor domain-containing protein [Staphylococcus petrasii]SUM58725.1 LPXTG family cell wall anchor protein [Staphylococcus petrasii]